MKKFLSLVLAMVMTMSLVTISAGAKDFTDGSEINYAEAVDVISALDIVDGYTDGSFNPESTLTRGAAAKIICNLILGPTTASALQADTAPFSDVPANHTFAGYIAYCASQGIINGYNDDTFRPAGTLTGYAFMKMLLGALGYDGAVEGYTGANWSVNVAKQALAIGLDDGNDGFNGVQAVTREEACLYAFNTLTATMVEYSQKIEINTGAGSTVTMSGGRQEVESTNKVDYDGSADDKTQFCEKYFPNLTLIEDTDEFGRFVNTWKVKKNEIGSYVKTPDALYHADVNAKTIYADVDLADNYKFDVLVDGEDNNIGEFSISKKGTNKVSDVDADAIIGNGSDIYVYVRDDADEDRIVVINTYLVEVADDYDDKNDELDISDIDDIVYPDDFTVPSALSSDDWDGLDEYADGDFLTITVANGEIQSVAKAEMVTATVTEYVHGESVTADGEEYAYSAASNHNNDDGDLYSYTLKSVYELYLDEEGNVLYAIGEETDDNFVYIAEFSKHSTSTKAAAQAYAYFTDGTEEELSINKVKGTKVTASNVSGNDIVIGENTYTAGWYTYTLTGEKYNLTPATETGHHVEVAAGTVVVDYSLNHTEITNGTDTKDGTKTTNFIVIDKDGDVKVYTGIKNAPDIVAAADTIVNIQYSGSYAKNVYIDVQSGSIKNAGTTSSDVIFLLSLKAQGNDSDDDEYYRYNALVNGKETTVRYSKATGADGKALTLWTDIEYTSKNYIEDATEVTGSVAANRDDFSKDTISGNTVTVSGNTIVIGSKANNDYYMADDYTIFVIETDGDYDTYTMNQLKRVSNLDGDTIYGVLNDDGEYTALYIVRN